MIESFTPQTADLVCISLPDGTVRRGNVTDVRPGDEPYEVTYPGDCDQRA